METGEVSFEGLSRAELDETLKDVPIEDELPGDEVQVVTGDEDYFYSEGDYSNVVESLPTIHDVAKHLGCETSSDHSPLELVSEGHLRCTLDAHRVDLYQFSSDEQFRKFISQLSAAGIDEHRLIQSAHELAIVPEDPYDLAAISISLP